MEEDGAKAQVTRLRRRLSVEQSEDVKSPSAPSTPSKKRGGRLAAKPQLELIDENALENVPKRQTKKSAAKDVIEASEEKVLTPSRRSTRIKSNTSIISDTPQSFDSPRAKRAARRNSQIGSDNEAPLTPVRQTIRTRKDSTSSVDKQENTKSDINSSITVYSVIEEVETNSQKSLENDKEISPKRKSPRLKKKNEQGDTDKTPDTDKTNENKISDDSFKLINSLDDQPVKKTKLNSSASSVNPKKSLRNRTNTWTAAENDNSNIKKQINLENKKEATEKENNSANNNDKQDTSSNKIKDDIEGENKDLLHSSKLTQKRNSISSENSKLEHIFNVMIHDQSNLEKSCLNTTNDTEHSEKTVLNETEKLFEKAPATNIQPLIYFDDSDSDSKGKPVPDKPGESEDQCVPVVPEILNQNDNANDKPSSSETCEPMDIDESIHINESLIISSNDNQGKDTHEMLEKSNEHNLQSGENVKSPNKSKRESTSSLSISQNDDKTGNENKSTLILSQLKDVSTNDNSLTKSPKAAIAVLSNSVTEMNENKDTNKKDSMTYITSTPLQQKKLKNMAIQINTSVINDSNNGSTQQSPTKKNKNNYSKQSNKSSDVSCSEESDAENVSTKDKSDFLDDAAEEANDDYQSGDSQDEEERQYAKENEILEKGQTLNSDDDASDDTDYEKDSFVVSSDEEDNDLLSGSGDDLCMNYDELTMSKKSKKKFDERRSKEQKKASIEMYEARHNISNNSSKAEITKQKKRKRQRLNSSTSQLDEEPQVKSKKNNRMRIDSSQDSSTGNIEEDPKDMDTNTSMSKEHEITSVCNESIMNKNDPLSMNVKTEPETPLKDLDMSTVPILNNIEEVQIDQNVTLIKSNETSDPLQEDSDASSISENMEISSNYDSVLKELNKQVENRKIKSLDMSLNLKMKTKQSAKDPIVDNLNLTNTEKSKRDLNKDKVSANANPSQRRNSNSRSDTKNKAEFDESSSDSIDLQFLLSEDSRDSIKKVSESKQNESESFIPLKRTEAKTNIPEENKDDFGKTQKLRNMATFMNQSQSANTSAKKQKKKISLSVSEENTENITVNPEMSLNSMFDTSSNKKKNSMSRDGIDLNGSQNESSDNISMNSMLNKSKKKKKKNGLSVGDETSAAKGLSNEIDQNISQNEMDSNQSLNTSTKKKKKNSLSDGDKTSAAKGLSNEIDQNISQNEMDSNQSLNTSTKKKKKNSLSDGDKTSAAKGLSNEIGQNISQNEIDSNLSMNSSTKKNKKNSLSVGDKTSAAKGLSNEIGQNISLNEIDSNQSMNTSTKKKKKNSLSVGDETSAAKGLSNEIDQNISQNKIDSNQSMNSSTKKKKKIFHSVGDDTSDTVENDPNLTINNSTKKKKKKRNISVSDEINEDGVTQNVVDPNQSPNTSTKTKSKKDNETPSYMLESATNIENANNLDEQVVSEMVHNKSLNNTLNISSKKKKKHNKSVSEEMDDKNNISITNKGSDISLNRSSLEMSTNSPLNTSSKKKKKKNSFSVEIDSERIEVITAQSDANDFNKSSNQLTPSTAKKKTLKDSNLNLSSASINGEVNNSLSSSAKKKKNTKAELHCKDIEKDPLDGDSDAPIEIPYTSHKNISEGDTSVHIFVDTEGNQDWNTLITSGSSKKKNKKKKEAQQETPSAVNEIVVTTNKDTGKSKKRKRDSPANSIFQEAVTAECDQKLLNDSVYSENKRKKHKTSQSEDIPTDIKDTKKKQNKKRKQRDDDEPTITSKVFKQNSSEILSVPRLPSTILNQLEDKPRKDVLEKKKAKVVSTTQFIVGEHKRKNKPSNYLERSVYLNDSVDEKKQKGFIKIPKVLPTVPTATISGSGFTTKFQINVLAKETKFVAQTSNITGFKNEYLSSKKIKKAGTYLMYKSQRNSKMSKF